MAAELSLEALRDEIDKIDEVHRPAARQPGALRLRHRPLEARDWAGRSTSPRARPRVIAHVRAVNESLGGPLDGDAVARFYERVMDEARRIQRIEARERQRPNSEQRRTRTKQKEAES